MDEFQSSSIRQISASTLPCSYKAAPKLWRHSLHTICSRVAMFPPQLVHYFITRYSHEGDVITDPWAGVGTVPLQACLDGRIGVGSDISPEAWCVMAAKVNPPERSDVFSYLDELELRTNKLAPRSLDELGTRIGIQHYYHRRTLQEILRVRDILKRDRKSKPMNLRRNAIFASALTLGILHGDRPESLSLIMDSSKAYSPVHILLMQRKYHERFRPRYKNVISCLKLKTEKVLSDLPHHKRGSAYNVEALRIPLRRETKLVLTSPPYLRVHQYAYDNRVRLWFLGFDYKVVDKRIFGTWNLERYFTEISNCLLRLEHSMSKDSICVLAMGDVRKDGHLIKCGELFSKWWTQRYSDKLRLKYVVVDRIRLPRRRYFNLRRSEGVRTERILVLAKGKPKSNNIHIRWT